MKRSIGNGSRIEARSFLGIGAGLGIALGQVCVLSAAFEFNGGQWCYSESPTNVTLNREGHLVWNQPRPPQQWTVKVPEQDLSDVGDVAKVALRYKAEGSTAGRFWDDLSEMAGTGDFRIGLFDSNNEGHVSQDGHDYKNRIWAGYLGYHARIFPHIAQGHERTVIDGEVHLPGKLMKRTKPRESGVGKSLVASSGSYEHLRYIDGFDLELGEFSPLVLKLERTGPDTLVFSITLNGITYRYEDDESEHQPQKIDAMAIYFPNHRPYEKILFAPPQKEEEKQALPSGGAFTNSIGMEFVRIEPGSYEMGFEGEPLNEEILRSKDSERVREFLKRGNYDEHPRHRVTLTKPYYIGVFEVSNEQYEEFDPGHRQYRGAHDRSHGDDDPVIMVSWEDAQRFCRWLSEKEGRPYRLPTEAEWEYACRAGSRTPYHTGENLPASDVPPNDWGLQAMHGGVEEWCYDWYGPYPDKPQTDPVGRKEGTFKVTRGGSYGTDDFYLRSANRGGTIKQDKSWILGFRVVLGGLPESNSLPVVKQSYQKGVKQAVPEDLAEGPDRSRPYFKIRRFVNIPEDEKGPMHYYHNHNPDIVACPNGDLLAIHFSTQSEGDREMIYAGSRLRYGEDEWDSSSVIWAPPDRKAEYGVLWEDNGTLYNFYSLGAYRSRPSAVVMRTSEDNGASWSKPRVIAERAPKQGVMESVIRMDHGTIVVPADSHNLFTSFDDGKTWSSPVRGDLEENGIAGIHTPIVELANGDLMAFGRYDDIDGRMPKSLSSNVGQTWRHSASPFPPIGGGQRATMLRLQEGPLFFASFAEEMAMSNGERQQSLCSGLFVALSFDEGKTWPIKQLVSDGSGRKVFTRKNNYYRMTPTESESNGYLASCQTRDGIIHMVSNRVEYAFNLKWIWPDYRPDGKVSPPN